MDNLKELLLQNQPLRKYGFELSFVKLAKNPLGNVLIEFESNEFNNRTISFSISEIYNSDKHLFLMHFWINKQGERKPDEDCSLKLEKWLKEKKYKFNQDVFSIYPEKGNIDNQFSYFFNFIDETFQIEELSKIIKGEYWEFRTTDWGLFGR